MSMTSSDNFIGALTDLSKRMGAISFLEGSSKSTRAKIYLGFPKAVRRDVSVSESALQPDFNSETFVNGYKAKKAEQPLSFPRNIMEFRNRLGRKHYVTN